MLAATTTTTRYEYSIGFTTHKPNGVKNDHFAAVRLQKVSECMHDKQRSYSHFKKVSSIGQDGLLKPISQWSCIIYRLHPLVKGWVKTGKRGRYGVERLILPSNDFSRSYNEEEES